MNSNSARLLAAVALGLYFTAPVSAQQQQQKSSKEIIQKKKVETENDRVEPTRVPTRVVPSSKVIIPKKQTRKHIRWALPTDDRNEVDFHAVMTQSTRTKGFSIEYFDDSRRRELETTITCFKDNRRDEGYGHWLRFVASLDTFDKPVDLEPVMYHVLREGCLRQDPNVLFHAERLERAQVDLDNLGEYWEDLARIGRQCDEPGNLCVESVDHKLADELEIVRQERDLALARVRVAQRALERAQLTSTGDVTRSVDTFYTVAQEITRRTEIVLYAATD
jgi:hypothetical protein